MLDFEGKNIQITGGNSGIGFAVAKQFIAQGADVYSHGRAPDKVLSALHQLG